MQSRGRSTIESINQTFSMMREFEAARQLSMGLFSHMPIHIDNYIGNKSERIQIRFPRTKKRRIRKKFARDHRNFIVRHWQEPAGYRGPGFFVVNDEMMKLIRSKVQSQ